MSSGYTKRKNNSSYGHGDMTAGNKGGRNVWRQSKVSKAAQELELVEKNDVQDEEFGYTKLTAENTKEPRLGWMFNFTVSQTVNEETKHTHTCLNMYFVEEDGATFKAQLMYMPYFLIYVAGLDTAKANEVESYLFKKFDSLIAKVELIHKEDLDLLNHLSGLKSPYLKLSFRNETDLMAVRNDLRPLVAKNMRAREAKEAYAQATELESSFRGGMSHVAVSMANKRKIATVLDSILDLREYDVPYDQRVCIDTGIRVGMWYDVTPQAGGELGVQIKKREDLVERPMLKILAYDIETTKQPLKFPNAEFDKVMMISYMVDGQGYLIVNREVVSADIDDFDYTPKPEYEGPFSIFNEKDEVATLKRFFSHIVQLKPHVIVTYNGDYFDMPFVEKRAQVHGMSMEKEIALTVNRAGEYDGRFFVHLDAFYWVKRDSYLPQGSQGLKAVTKAKLKYNPTELDPEDMLPFATERPKELAAYSVSDAVATYYLYIKYVHLFIFSLCNIIPLSPKDVLRKGSGTLCETLLMVQAFEANVVCPNKQKEKLTDFYKGHLLESQTYIGGHVECLESGVFRADFPYKFQLQPKAVQDLIDGLDDTLKFAIEDEAEKKMEDMVNYTEVRDDIKTQLEALRDEPNIEITPLIYHLDVGAMYPNIILTNRLQPMSIVDKGTCAACDFNRPGKQCQREMQWHWRGKYYPTTRSEYEVIKNQLQHETVKLHKDETLRDRRQTGVTQTAFTNLSYTSQIDRIKKRVALYSSKVYRKVNQETVEERDAIICQRENPFYVNTVRDFRDRRYIYKGKKRDAERAEKEAKNALELTKARDLVLLWDSLQLAHKCILNSFYGYVMRKGARWRSIEMAGVVTKTGADIIKAALNLVEKLGRPLELDTDGIWAILPSSFPENFKFHTAASREGKARPLTVSYPCIILNKLTNDKFSNDQYQDLDSLEKRTYTVRRECSIFFEVDGPYRAMVLPAAQKEGENIKKRYAVFNKDGTLAELKGFEIKRRGELKLIKIFQGQIFAAFLDGNTLKECYDAVGTISNHWLDICYNKGADLEDDDVFDLISENKTMKEAVADYGDRKSTSITTALRLSQFLGAEMAQSKGLNCKFIIANRPVGASTSVRAIPVAIWNAEPAVKKHYLRKWLGDSSLNNFDVRDVIDWGYYIGRLGSAIQKIITIPAAFQNIANPVPRVKHPDWLTRIVHDRNDSRKQTSVTSFFQKVKPTLEDLEDFGSQPTVNSRTGSPIKKQYARVTRRVPVNQGKSIFHDGSKYDKSLIAQQEEEKKQAANAAAEERKHKRPRTIVTDADGAMMLDEQSGDEQGIEDEDGDTVMQDSFNVARAETKAPDFYTDRAASMAWQKKNWAKIRAKMRRKREAEAAAESYGRLDAARLGVQGFFEAKTKQMTNDLWQIVQIVPETSPGLFTLWIVANKMLQKVKVRVPRTFYVNTKEASETAASMGQIVSKNLPRGRPAMHLYEITMEERDYVENKKELNTFLTHDSVEGVYETKIPLAFNLMMDVGCIAKLNKSTKPDTFNTYSSTDLMFKDCAETGYLADNEFQTIYMYHSQNGDRGVFGLFPSNGSSQCLIVCVNPTGQANEKLNFKAALKAAWKAQFEDTDAELSQEERSVRDAMMPDYNFVFRSVKTKERAYDQINEFLQKQTALSTSTASQTLVLAQTTETLEMLHLHLPILKDNFPVICIAPNATDNDYQFLAWYRHAVHRMMQRFFLSSQWYKEQLDLCQYAHVPIGNMGRDYPVLVSDVFFARALRRSGHILWLSPSPKPDLAGVEEDENYYEAEFKNPEISTPGAYRTVSVEMDLQHFSTNTILKADAIEELEGGLGTSGAVDRPDVNTEYTEGTYACRNAFKVLKNLVSKWLADTLRNLNENADLLLRQMYRWLRSTTSMLFDPALLRMVHTMMNKVLMQLVQRFRKLRAVVVYASFTKIIICTQKETIPASLAYLNYVNSVIQAKPIFQFVQFETVAMWEALLFMDINNHGGLVPSQEQDTLPHQDDEQQEPEEESSDDEEVDGYNSDGEPVTIRRPKVRPSQPSESSSSSHESKDSKMMMNSQGMAISNVEPEPELISHWTLPHYLPKFAGDWFLVVTSEFLTLPHEYKKQQMVSAASQFNSQSDAYATPEVRKAKFIEFIQQLVLGHFQQKLCSIVSDLQKQYHGDELAGEDQQSSEFPVLPGSHLPLHSPALEFIKFVTHVFALDENVTDQSLRLKESLMKMLKVKPYSQQGTFRDPCLTYVLPGVICAFCNGARDLDLCRDPLIVSKQWKCALCEHSYDTELIEAMLVDVVSRRSVAYQVQDLICVACGGIKVTSTSLYCECSGRYECLLTRDKFISKIKAFANIADFYEFQWLKETVEWVMQV